MAYFVSRPIDPPRRIAAMSHCATLFELPNRDRLAAWFSGSYETAPDQFIALSRRPAGTQAWSAPEPLIDTPEHADGQPVFLLDLAGTLWLYYVTLHGRDWTSAHMMRRPSTDGGHHWGPSEPLPFEEGFMFRSRPLALGPGKWLFPVYDEKTWRSFMLISTDDGATWRAGPFLETPVGNIHPCVVSRSDGSLMAFLRPGGQGGCLWQTLSYDEGETWTAPEPTPIPNPNSGFDLLRLSGGELLLAFNHSPRQRTPLCVALSEDEGKTWAHVCMLENSQAEFSYPTLLQGQDGLIHCAYTWRRQCIVHAAFDRDWLRLGLPLTPHV